MLNESSGLNDCEIRSDFWGGTVKGELGIVDVGMSMAAYACIGG